MSARRPPDVTRRAVPVHMGFPCAAPCINIALEVSSEHLEVSSERAMPATSMWLPEAAVACIEGQCQTPGMPRLANSGDARRIGTEGCIGEVCTSLCVATGCSRHF